MLVLRRLYRVFVLHRRPELGDEKVGNARAASAGAIQAGSSLLEPSSTRSVQPPGCYVQAQASVSKRSPDGRRDSLIYRGIVTRTT